MASGPVVSPTLPVVVKPLRVQVLTPEGETLPSTGLEGGRASDLVDGDTATTITTERDVVVALRPDAGITAFELEHLLVHATTEGGPYQLYGVYDSDGETTEPLAIADLPLLAEGTFHTGQNNIDISAEDAGATLAAVLLYLPPHEDTVAAGEGPGVATLREISVIGRTHR